MQVTSTYVFVSRLCRGIENRLYLDSYGSSVIWLMMSSVHMESVVPISD